MRGLLLSLLLIVPNADANLTVHPMRTSVDAKKGTQIRVYSQSPQPQYVQASVRRIANAADADEQEVEIDPAAAAIAITPAKFALAGGGNRLIRVIPLQPVAQETAYRVYFEGVRGPDENPADGGGGTARANLGVSLVWGALVNVVPADGRVAVQLRGSTLHNLGTLRLGITSVADCEGTRCTAHELSRSLYPGSAVLLPFAVTPGRTVQLRYRLTREGYREHVLTLGP
ncbi:pilus assembly protein [Stenotrophomonas sp. 24(2023)]|uniref:pilus assembly protein n=1 Tax=Stenotrophomonas sp. 24(2023) TaxID=3068324 RepID=UPI0027E1B13F|nr:pilus assembly protein [Stenotrophomonas sp. 24(2023)]WMJ71417.1 pilus assembly protein [Stenotrophomonas sp. 24(2023)]